MLVPGAFGNGCTITAIRVAAVSTWSTGSRTSQSARHETTFNGCSKPCRFIAAKPAASRPSRCPAISPAEPRADHLQSSIASIISHSAICSKSAVRSRPWVVVVPIRAGADPAGCGTRLVEMVGLDEPQTPLEVAGLDRPDEGVDHRRYRRCLARRDRPTG